MYIEEKQVIRIGEDLGELLNWSLEEQYPMVQVMLEGEAPLVMFRETVSENGELFRIRFNYAKLQNHCKLCYRLTHDSRTCSTRLGPNWNHRERQRQPLQRRGEEEEGRGARVPRDDKARQWRSREENWIPRKRVENRATSPKRKPVRRNLAVELGDTVREVGQRRIAKGSTKDWVRKTFPKEAEGVSPTQSTSPIFRVPIGEAGGSVIHSDTWYQSTEEEARAAKLVYAQNEAWEKAEGGYRQSEMIEVDPMDIQR